MGPVGSQEDTSGFRMVPYRSENQSYTNTGQSSDPSRCVGTSRAISGSDGFASELYILTRWDPTKLNGSLDCPLLVQNRCRDPYGTLRRPHGHSRAPTEPDRPLADRQWHRWARFIGASPAWAARSSYWHQPVYLCYFLGWQRVLAMPLPNKGIRRTTALADANRSCGPP